MSCDHSHVPLHCQIIKRKRKEKSKEKKYSIKKNVRVQVHHNNSGNKCSTGNVIPRNIKNFRKPESN